METKGGLLPILAVGKLLLETFLKSTFNKQVKAHSLK